MGYNNRFRYLGACLVVLLGSAALAEEPVDRLIRQLSSGRFEEREQAAKELIALGAPALPRLRQAAQSPDPDIARQAKVCIPQIQRNEQISAFLAQLKDRDPRRRGAALSGLMELRYENTAAILTEALDDPDSELRRWAACALANLGPLGRVAIPRMLEILQDSNEAEDVRWTMAFNLGTLGHGEEQVAPILLALLESESPKLRQCAALALGNLGAKHPDVVPAILKAMNDSDYSVQHSAIRALGHLAKEPKVCVPALMKRLRWLMASQPHKEKWKKHQLGAVISVLGCFGADAAEAAPLIAEIARDAFPGNGNPSPDDVIRLGNTISALEKVGPPAIPALMTLYTSGDNSLVRSRAARALTKLTGQEYRYPE